ncbi:hypothetical protein BOO86_09165 [Mycobacterium sp. CBMA 234]|uniref:hypothetical protein n=1 Tax=Mycolicibacterium sp. CBMA 234 TaxID=1918495 RepID=UPI001EE408B3|nr:hypothetical protein [Mycolicibacterium sp. CBMA 234]MUL64629.1 hypothetical protein [Mycolicibacterium sp. CBMA 234]
MQFVLRLLPLTGVDQLLYLLHFSLRSEHHLVVAADPFATEHRSVQAIERVARSGTVDRGTETTQAQQGRSNGPDDRQRSPRFLAVQPLL